MKRLSIVLAIYILWHGVEAQTVNQFQRNYPTIRDRIHFSENQGSISTSLPQDIKSSGNEKTISTGNQNHRAEDSYLQGIATNAQFGQFRPINPSTNANIEQQLNIELQPPPFNGNRNPDYYGTIYDANNINSATKKDLVGGAGGVPLQNTALQNLHYNNVSRAISHFGINILKNINNDDRNLVISPYSIATLLSLLQQGAVGEAQQQISMALRMLPATAGEAFSNLASDVQKRNTRNILRVANNVYVADSFDLNPVFKRVASQNFGSEVTPIGFARSQEAVQKINQWVAANTNNKITELLTSDDVGENTQLVLVNAVYFKGLWQVRFKSESTLPRDFHLSSGTTKSIPFMRMRGIFKTGIAQNNNAHVLILPFEKEQYSLVLVLPPESSSLAAVVASLTESELAEYQNFTPKDVNLEVPKFTIRADTNLKQVLMNMGVRSIFNQQSELTGLGTYRNYSPQVSSAVHTAMLSIDEDGATAAAATAFAVVALSYDDPSIVFKANRPFLAVLWDKQSALPLFMARVQDPVQ